METITDDTKKHLGEWINALFIAEGLSDEVMSSCSPQDFYRLVPTLLSQSLSACENRNKLSVSSLMSGFKYFSEVHKKNLLTRASLYCPFPDCDRNSSSGHGFTRKENLNEHKRRRHHGEQPPATPTLSPWSADIGHRRKRALGSVDEEEQE
jgi:hypothetical protein